MNSFFRTPIGAAIIGAIALAIGVFLSAQLGLTEDPTASSYLLGAGAGFVGGYFGGVIRQRRDQ